MTGRLLRGETITQDRAEPKEASDAEEVKKPRRAGSPQGDKPSFPWRETLRSRRRVRFAARVGKGRERRAAVAEKRRLSVGRAPAERSGPAREE